MSHSHEIALWIDAEKYEALAKQLEKQGKSLEQTVAEMIKKLYDDVVPVDQRREITKRAEEERRQQEKEKAAQRRYALFKITKNGSSISFEDEFYTESFSVALLLRRFLRGENDIGDNFFNGTPKAENIYRTTVPLDKYDEQASLFTGDKHILRVFDIDLDHGYFSIGDRQRGCTTYRTGDVSTAAYYAGKAESRNAGWREKELFRRLEGKTVCMTPTQNLLP